MVANVSGEPARIWRRALILGGACLAGLAAVYLLAVRTAPGQSFEDAVLRAADVVAGGTEQVRALDTLDAISIPSVVAAVILILLIGFMRRRLLLGLLSAGMIAASLVTTELIQRFAERPVLLAHGYRREDQSFPSGHATVAMSLMCALVMVVPYRFRGLAVLLTSLWAAGVGMATVLIEPDVSGRAHLVGMWVDPGHRGRGVAMALLDHAVRWARERGASEMILWVADHNTAARRLYERAGFAATGDRQPLPSNPALPESMLRLELPADP
jgi:ribosomal protein S18 acetylase RimI-like enzyme